MVLGEFWLRLDKTMLMWLFFCFFLLVCFCFLFIKGVAQFLTYVIIYQVHSSNRCLEFHFIKLFIMTVDMG